jgi:hypothetical protein
MLAIPEILQSWRWTFNGRFSDNLCVARWTPNATGKVMLRISSNLSSVVYTLNVCAVLDTNICTIDRNLQLAYADMNS